MHSLLNCCKLLSDRRFLSLVFSIVFAPQLLMAQSEKSSSVSKFSIEETIYQTADQMPEYPGGEEAKKEYFANALNQPRVGETGMEIVNVYVSFIIEKDGSVSNVKIVKSFSHSIDTLTINAIKNMPPWLPGRVKGNSVRVKYLLPVEFWQEKNEFLAPKSTNEAVTTFHTVAAGKNNIVADTAYNKTLDGSDEVYTIVENSPSFPGGQDALKQYISDNLRFPQILKELSIQGTVYITFIVEKDGNISNAGILKGIHPYADAEALRIINSMPAWKPGMQGGRPQRIRMNIPVKFSYK